MTPQGITSKVTLSNTSLLYARFRSITWKLLVYVDVCMYAHIHIHDMYIYAHNIPICMYTHMCLHTCTICVYIYIHVVKCVCVCIYL